jgi:7-cyano-7-deazaguanine reductase
MVRLFPARIPTAPPLILPALHDRGRIMRFLDMTDPDSRVEGLRPGERAIAEAKLEPLPNPSKHREYVIHFSYPEFTCHCPMTGYPDFATIDVWMAPDATIIELKSLKLYLNRYRDYYAFHEDVTNRILDDIVAAASPRWARISADWNARGNLKTVITAEHNADRRPAAWTPTG